MPYRKSKEWAKPFIPPLGTQVAWGKSISKNLVGAWLGNLRGGQYCPSLVNPNDKATFTNSAAYTKGIAGECVDTSGVSGKGMVISSPSAKLKPATTVSIVWCGVITQDATNLAGAPSIMRMQPDNTDGLPYDSYGIYRDGTSQSHIGFGWNDGSTTPRSMTVSGQIEYYKPVMFSLTVGNGKAVGYKNGIAITSTTTGIGTIYYNTTAKMDFGRHNTLNYDTRSQFIAGYVWDRVLTAAEMRDLSQNWFLPLVSPSRRIISGASAAPSISQLLTLLGIGS